MFSFMSLVNHVFTDSWCIERAPGTASSIPSLSQYARPASADLVVRFVRPLDDDDEKRPFTQALSRLLAHAGLQPLTPLTHDKNAFDGARKKGEHQTMIVSLPADKAHDVRQLANGLKAVSRQLRDEARPEEVVLRHQLARVFGGASPSGPSC